jgi:hypothetical protein
MPRKLFHAGSTTVKKGAKASPLTHKEANPPLGKPVAKAGAPIGMGPNNASGYFQNTRKTEGC